MDASFPDRAENTRKRSHDPTDQAGYGDDSLGTAKRRATGDFVSSADRVDSGFGEDPAPRRQHAVAPQQMPGTIYHYQNKPENVQPVPPPRTVAMCQLDGNVPCVGSDERRPIAHQTRQFYIGHYANEADATGTAERRAMGVQMAQGQNQCYYANGTPERRAMGVQMAQQQNQPNCANGTPQRRAMDVRLMQKEILESSIAQEQQQQQRQLSIQNHTADTAERRPMGTAMMQMQLMQLMMAQRQRQQSIDNHTVEDVERRSHALQMMQMQTLELELSNRRRLQLLATNLRRRPFGEHLMQLAIPEVEMENQAVRIKQLASQHMLQNCRNSSYSESNTNHNPGFVTTVGSQFVPSSTPQETTTRSHQDLEIVRRTMAMQPAQLYSTRSHYENVVGNSSSSPSHSLHSSTTPHDPKFEQPGAGQLRDWREISSPAKIRKTDINDQADASAFSPTFPIPSETNSPYSTLPYTDSFRLLHIMPGFKSDSIICELQTTRLEPVYSDSEGPQHFEAISYVWGSDMNKQAITCNGQPVQVTRNLHDALQRLRYEDRQRCIWADAVCIDQSNVDERGHQVRLMRSIYKAASRVVIWLGADSNWDAFRALTIICGIANRHLRGKGGTAQACFIYRGNSLIRNDEEPAPHSEDWTAVARLYDRDWFWRMWCVQEAALASDAVMIWGDDAEISWKWVGLAAARIRTNNYQVLQRHKMAGVFNAYLMYRISLNASDLPPLSLTIPFVRLLGLTRQFEAKDPRDRIFGLLGLPTNDSDPDNGQLFLQPDYNLSVLETYKRLTLKVFDQDRNCDILSSVQHGDTLDLDFPSWIPRWDKVHTLVICPTDPVTTFKACGSCILPSDAGYRQSPDSAVVGPQVQAKDNSSGYLSLQGIIVDDICSLVPIMALPPANATSTDTIMSRLGVKFIGIQARENARRLCWTLTAGKDWYGTPVMDQTRHLADFKAALINMLSPSGLRSGLADISRLSANSDDADRFDQSASNACKGRKLFFTKGGRLGLGPMAMQEGDVLCVIFGGSVPYILRADGDSYRLVGECYVYNLMNGEAISMMQKGLVEKRWFKIL